MTETKSEIESRAVAACGDLIELLIADGLMVDIVAGCFSPANFPRSTERELLSFAMMLWTGYGELPELGRWLKVCSSAEQQALLKRLADRAHEKRLFRLLAEQRGPDNLVPKCLADLVKSCGEAAKAWEDWLEWERVLDGNLT